MPLSSASGRQRLIFFTSYAAQSRGWVYAERHDEAPTMKCRQCKSGALGEAAYVREFYPGRLRVAVVLLQSVCDSCGHTRTLSAQHDENLRRLAARKSAYGDVLMGEDYIALRKRHSLTRPQMARVLGVSNRTYTRYENEEAYPVKATRLLIELAMCKPEVLHFLADKADLALGLREEC